MFAGLGAGRDANLKASKAQVEVEMAAHRRRGGRDRPRGRHLEGRRRQQVRPPHHGQHADATSPARPPATTSSRPRPIRPAARCSACSNNCAGGNTPWGTWLTCEENFNGYFGGDAAKLPDAEAYKRYGIGRRPPLCLVAATSTASMSSKEPNEPNRFGWVVEIDPYDRGATPMKRTALGRFKHEGCTYALAKDGRVVFYSGDDERFDYVYKFVTARPWNPNDRAANRDLLDDGTLYVARFNDDGKVEWLPLVHGQGPLTAENGFTSQADVLIKTRLAADLLKPTPMDRPEDIETNPVNGRVYVVLTNNSQRTRRRSTRANPRAAQRPRPYPRDHAQGRRPRRDRGHLVDLPARPASPAWTPARAITARRRTMAGCPAPTTCAFDSKGRIWIATDGAPTAAGIADGIYGADTTGYGRALTRCFYQAPTGAEVCGPIFTPDDTHVLPRHPASRRGRRLDLREALDALAGLQGRHAAAAVGDRDHEEGRRRDRVIARHQRSRSPPSRPSRTASPAAPGG